MFVNMVFDVILVCILIGGSSYGYNKGLFKMAIGPIRLIFSVTISLFYCNLVGNRVIAPVLANYVELFSIPALKAIINPLSIAIAFGLIFLLNKIIFSFLISIINRIIEKGIAEKVDSAIGLVFAGTVAFLSVATIVSVSQYLLINNEFFGAVRSIGFSGGPLYKFFVSVGL